MKPLLPLLLFGALFNFNTVRADTHVWEKVELAFHAKTPYANPYTNVEVWVDLKGPGFDRRCYGFWDGGDVFRVRILATRPGKWTWRSGSNQKDAGLNHQRGGFNAVEWSAADRAALPLRRGFIRPSANGHAFEYADGTPFILLGDTWYAAGTYRFKWNDDDRERPIGPDAGFKDYVRLRKSQGFNSVAIIAAFPNWANDGQPWEIWIDQESDLGVRSAWVDQGDIANRFPRNQWHPKDMSNEGGRAFLFPGKVPGYEQVYPDVDRVNPDYYKYLDRKIDYLNAQGFVPVIEVARRDMTSCWAKYYHWPESYSRYIEYVWSRYQANNCLFSPVHYDYPVMTATTTQLNQAANLVIAKYGPPPFGTLASCNASVSSLLNFGGPEQNHWLTFHQIGNLREHDAYWYLTEIFNSWPARPALNGEPYYSGMADKRYPLYQYGAPGGTADDDRDVRSGIYGSFLSGGFAGHIYGAEGIWGADIEPGSDPFMWQAFQWNSANQMRYLKTFALSEGSRYEELVPDANLVSPSETHLTKGFTGWAYCARTPDKAFSLAYFEKDCQDQSLIRGASPHATYRAEWFDPRTGQWSKAGNGLLEANGWGWIHLPDFPSHDDWGLKLVAAPETR
ncbi:MAG TPA: DUF5060 domain-containing protein [Verrucomicrobiae bacterium]|nr:DUF5060 domain-containing protein [Verrucomicrobiae bacterium]